MILCYIVDEENILKIIQQKFNLNHKQDIYILFLSMLDYNLQTIGRLLKLNSKELFFQIKSEIENWLYKNLTDNWDIIPNTIYFETWSFCPQRCKWCYVPISDRKQDIQLSDAQVAQVMDFAQTEKIPYIAILWWDPFHDLVFDRNYKIFSWNPQIRYVVCNDWVSLSQSDKMQKIKRLPNTSPVFSIDGFSTTNEKIRWNWIFDQTIDCMKEYGNNWKNFFWSISTIRPENVNEVTDEEFIRFLIKNWSNYISYANIYTDIASWAYPIAPEEYWKALINLMKISKKVSVPILTSQFWQISLNKISLKSRLHNISVDYKWNIFSSRRWISSMLWTMTDDEDSFKNIIYSERTKTLLNKKHRDLSFGDISRTDIRYNWFMTELIKVLESSWVNIEKPK